MFAAIHCSVFYKVKTTTNCTTLHNMIAIFFMNNTKVNSFTNDTCFLLLSPFDYLLFFIAHRQYQWDYSM